MPKRTPPPSKRILVVDDDPDWRAYLTLALDELGYASAEASDGDEALERMGSEAFPLVLLDLNMPRMRGEEVVKHLPKKQAPKVVFLTSAAASDVGGALRKGPFYYLPKGANREQLSLLLHSLDL